MSRFPTRMLAPAIALLVLGAGLSACVPEPTASPASTPSVSIPPSPTAPPIDESQAPVTLPQDCAGAYSTEMAADLQAQGLPLNDPGIELLSTERGALLDIIAAAPTLRCTWGTPGEAGLSTNITVVDGDQAAAVVDELAQSGFGCESEQEATVCRSEQRGVDLDGQEYERGEIHAVQGDLWVATAWVNVDPEGYTDDILATLRS